MINAIYHAYIFTKKFLCINIALLHWNTEFLYENKRLILIWLEYHYYNELYRKCRRYIKVNSKSGSFLWWLIRKLTRYNIFTLYTGKERLGDLRSWLSHTRWYIDIFHPIVRLMGNSRFVSPRKMTPSPTSVRWMAVRIGGIDCHAISSFLFPVFDIV